MQEHEQQWYSSSNGEEEEVEFLIHQMPQIEFAKPEWGYYCEADCITEAKAKAKHERPILIDGLLPRFGDREGKHARQIVEVRHHKETVIFRGVEDEIIASLIDKVLMIIGVPSHWEVIDIVSEWAINSEYSQHLSR